ncbi:hypothetical protein M8C21_032919, partial [Ambrosia artemisiifolia]
RNHHLARNEIPDRGRSITRDIVAITSTQVSNYYGLIQLESTYLTSVTINPNLPQTAAHVTRNRFYVSCSKCTKTLYPEEDESLTFVCKDDDDIVPNFKYCVNAKISDSTKSTDVTFFNGGMTALLNTSCEDLVMKHGWTDPKKLPDQIADTIGKPKLLHLTLKNEQIVVTNVTEPEKTVEGQSCIPPSTPNPKLHTTKRALLESPDTSIEPKRSKQH